jgi:hypothetical protein
MRRINMILSETNKKQNEQQKRIYKKGIVFYIRSSAFTNSF